MVWLIKELLILSLPLCIAWVQVILLFQVIYLTLHSDAVCNDKIDARSNFVPCSFSGLTKQQQNKAAQSVLPIGSWPTTCNVYVALCCILMRHTELQWADRGSTGTQRQALRQKHYRSEVKCSSTSLWDLNPEPSCNTLVARERKYYMLPVKALFYCFWVDKLHIFHVVCGQLISVCRLFLSQFSLAEVLWLWGK